MLSMCLQVILLEKTGLEQKESFSLQLVDLQQRAESLCVDLDSVLQAAVLQAAEDQTLLDIKTRLDTEIHVYKRLLDHLSKRYGPKTAFHQLNSS